MHGARQAAAGEKLDSGNHLVDHGIRPWRSPPIRASTSSGASTASTPAGSGRCAPDSSTSPFSLAEARLLYELAHREGPTAAGLARDLGLDAGYLSRMLRGLERRRLISRERSESDGRQSLLSLTAAGHRTFSTLDTRSSAEVRAMLGRLSEPGQRRLVEAMRDVERLLGAPEPKVPYLLRPHRPGDMGWVVHRHGALYAREYGWDERFEALVATIVAKFVEHFDPKREHCWIAEREGEIVGSVFLVSKSADGRAAAAAVRRTGRARAGHRPPPRRRVRALRARQGLQEDRPLDQQHPARRPPHLRGGGLPPRRRGAAPQLRPSPGRADVGAEAVAGSPPLPGFSHRGNVGARRWRGSGAHPAGRTSRTI